MIERRQRIPAEEVIEPKRWNLPYWVEPEALVKAREKEAAQAELETEVEVEEEEIEVEPLTADQLEQIRQEAYNEGLEQGLIEGRQKGEKLGTQEGHKEGLATGTEEGHKLGFEAGNEQGIKQAQQAGEKKTAQTVQQLESVIQSMGEQLTSQKNAIENFLPDLVEMLAQAVIHEELSQGSEHIVALVNLALEALPLNKSSLTIEVNEKDLPFLEAAFEQNDIHAKLNTNGHISPGGCQLITDKSVADFSLEDRWGEVIKQYKNQLQLGLLQTPIEEDQATTAEPSSDDAHFVNESENENPHSSASNLTEEVQSQPDNAVAKAEKVIEESTPPEQYHSEKEKAEKEKAEKEKPEPEKSEQPPQAAIDDSGADNSVATENNPPTNNSKKSEDE
jgi:flagellar assembly protein FliH